MATQQGAISKRRKFVADGVFYAELNEFFQRELAEEGYSGVEVRVTPTVTDISRFEWVDLGIPDLITGHRSYPCNTYSGGLRRTRPTNPRTHFPHPKALQIP